MSMNFCRSTVEWSHRLLPFAMASYSAAHLLFAQGLAVPEWAQPGSPTHKQVPPPADFHRPSKNFDIPLGMFEGQSDIGAPLEPGSASYSDSTKQYIVNSAGYNVWYSRDEFRYLWRKMSGDISLAADVQFPNLQGYGDRKAMLVIRQTLDDDSKEVVVAEQIPPALHMHPAPPGHWPPDGQHAFPH